ncbi:MAG: response regulator transcription factor [Tangfeifania sp.]
MKDIYNILIVDDEKDLCEILQFNLESEGFTIDIAHSGEEALKKPIEKYDLILLDVMMSGMSGFKVANLLRKDKKIKTPIIFLTAKGEENDILTGFNVGADDYISKPFSIKEVIARIKAILKRGGHAEAHAEQLIYKNLKVDPQKKEISLSGQVVNLTRKEFEILALLLKNIGQYISREEILKRIWKDDVIVTERNVDVNIARLRKKIGEYGKNINGKSGYGYCFRDK